MKKLIATLGVAMVVALMTLGLAGSANAYGGQDSDGGVTPGGVSSGGVSDAGGNVSAGVLPSTGGPETMLLVGGVALLAVGGAAMVATRRRSDNG